MKKKILWVDDEAKGKYRELAADLRNVDDWTVDICLDAHSGALALTNTHYDAIVMDMRLPPGRDKVWRDLFFELELVIHLQHMTTDPFDPKLGMRLLQIVSNCYSFLNNISPQARIRLEGSLTEIRKNCKNKYSCFGVLTVEPWPDIEDELTAIGITKDRYLKKSSKSQRSVVSFVEKLLACQKT